MDDLNKLCAEFNAAYDAFEFRKTYDKYGPSEAAFEIWCAARRNQSTEPNGWIAVAIVGSQHTKVAFAKEATARKECIKGEPIPFWLAARRQPDALPPLAELMARILPPPGCEGCVVTEDEQGLVWKRREDMKPTDPVIFYDGDTRKVRQPDAGVVDEPEFSTDPDGELALDWHVGDKVLSVSIGGAGRVSYVCDLGDRAVSGTREFSTPASPVPASVRAAILEEAAAQIPYPDTEYYGRDIQAAIRALKPCQHGMKPEFCLVCHPEKARERELAARSEVVSEQRCDSTDFKGGADAVAAVVQFLMGEAPLEGVWYDEKHPNERDMFWWRSRLRAAIAAQGAKDGGSDA